MQLCWIVLCVISVTFLTLSFGQYSDQGLPASGGWHSGLRSPDYGDPSLIKPDACEGFVIRPLNRTTNQASRHKCACNSTHISCINLQMTPAAPGGSEPDIFIQLDDDIFKNIRSITIHGNNLERLPIRLFDSGKAQENLRRLNLSSNYFVAANPDCFGTRLESLEVLDLSDNELFLTEKDVHIFSNLPNLRELYLKGSFSPYRAQHMLPTLDQCLKNAAFKNLRRLVLDSNNFGSLPHNLGCYFPKLRFLSVRGNPIRDWGFVVNRTCFADLTFLDASHLAGIRSPDRGFVNFVESLPSLTSINLDQLHLNFTSDSFDFLRWLNTTTLAVTANRAKLVHQNLETEHLRNMSRLTPEQLAYRMANPPSGGCASTGNFPVLTLCILMAALLRIDLR